MSNEGIKVISQNRRARHDYALGEKFEAGLVLTGTEIKSIRNGQADLKRAFARPDQNGEIWVHEMFIPKYEQGNRENHEPERVRKLLLNRKEISKLEKELQERGVTLVPTRLYLKNGRAKLEIAVARGKKNYDKRQDIAKRDAKRQIDRAIKNRYNG